MSWWRWRCQGTLLGLLGRGALESRGRQILWGCRSGTSRRRCLLRVRACCGFVTRCRRHKDPLRGPGVDLCCQHCRCRCGTSRRRHLLCLCSQRDMPGGCGHRKAHLRCFGVHVCCRRCRCRGRLMGLRGRMALESRGCHILAGCRCGASRRSCLLCLRARRGFSSGCRRRWVHLRQYTFRVGCQCCLCQWQRLGLHGRRALESWRCYHFGRTGWVHRR